MYLKRLKHEKEKKISESNLEGSLGKTPGFLSQE